MSGTLNDLSGRQLLAMSLGSGLLQAAQMRRDAEWLEAEASRLAERFTADPSLDEAS
jgi:hypothetical protein